MDIPQNPDFPFEFELNGTIYKLRKPPSAWVFRTVNQNKDMRDIDMEAVMTQVWDQFVHPAEGDTAPADKPNLFDLNVDGQNEHEDQVFTWFVATAKRHIIGPLG